MTSFTLAETPLFAVECNEPEGLVTREVFFMPLSPQNLKTFWEKARQFRTLFGADINQDFKKFMELFVSQDGDQLRAHGLFWRIDDFVGVFDLTHITEIDALCHYTFFDRRHKGREELTRQLIRYVFREFGFRRLSVEIPKYASPHTFGFTTALGFKKEGIKRKSAPYKDDWFDVVCFGLLREEALKDAE